MGELAKLANIGVKVEQQLNEVGIHTPEELACVGSREAWLRIKIMDPSACIMRLNGLEGAIRGIRWHNLDDSTKQELREFYHSHK